MVLPPEASAPEPLHNKSFPQTQHPDVSFLYEKRASVEAIDLEKREYEANKEEDSEEDLDALIHELESADSDSEIDCKQAPVKTIIPSQLLQTDTTGGLSNSEVIQRRKRYGLNQLREEKENLLLKFVLFFVGPIQFVMEVRLQYYLLAVRPADEDYRQPLFWPLA